MKKISFSFLCAVSLLFFVACAPKRVTKAEKFPLMYQENPQAILILPPINLSTAADAKEYYSTTIQEPLAFTGHYTFPYQITAEILKMEGIYDSELLLDTPLSKFREFFGADAVLFTTINAWDMQYLVISSTLKVSVTCELKSTTSDQTLWNYNGTVVVDLSGGNTGGGLAGLVAKAIITAVNSAIADYVPYAQRANYMALSSMPFGKYHALYDKDKEFQIIDQQPNSTKKN